MQFVESGWLVSGDGMIFIAGLWAVTLSAKVCERGFVFIDNRYHHSAR